MILMVSMLLILAALTGGQSCLAAADDDYLNQQLGLIVKFAHLQNNNQPAREPDLQVIEKFLQSAAVQPEIDSTEIDADSLINFSQLAFTGSQNENSQRLVKILEFSGRLQYAGDRLKFKSGLEKHFSAHVKEAIKVNKSRAEHYAGLSNGKTRGLSRLYTSLEYCLLPLAAIFDRWAAKFHRQDIPVLRGDFVSMAAIPAVNSPATRHGRLGQEAISAFKTLLTSSRKELIRAATRRDFIRVQLAAIDTLHHLRQLEAQNNCHLALTLHFVESIGLAARNADMLGRRFSGKTDNFYRAFIILQASGLKLFAPVDLQAQNFHQAGIGIIANDLPAIPFP